MKKLAIVTSHPIQYNAPLFRLLTERNNIKIKVFYSWGKGAQKVKYDPGFRKNVEWDIPLLEGYEYSFAENISKKPGSDHYKGIITPYLVKDILQWKPDAVLVFGWSFISHMEVLRKLHGRMPVYFRGDSTLLDNGSGFKSIFKSLFLKWVYRHIDIAFFTGIENKKYFQQYAVKESNLIYAPHAIDNARFAGNEKEHLEHTKLLRREWGVTDNDLTVLFVGKLEPKKNPFFLIEVFKKLYGKNISLIIVGNGELESALKQACTGNRNIHIIPFQNQSVMPAVYRMADILILPSVGPGETWGLVANEAMNCGLTIMMSNKCGGKTDLVKEGITGFGFDPNDIHFVKEKLQYLAVNKKALEMLKQNAKQHISSFSFKNVAIAIENTLNK